jgi:5-formyltetrahydrofolate cyclo-ligase
MGRFFLANLLRPTFWDFIGGFMLTVKKNLRQRLRLARKTLRDEQRKQAALALARWLLQRLARTRRGSRWGIYLATGSELSLDVWVQALKRRRLPVVLLHPLTPKIGRRLQFRPLSAEAYVQMQRQKAYALQYGRYQTPSARPDALVRHPSFKVYQAGNYVRLSVQANHLDQLILPVLGVDEYGHRLGAGGGYYDTSLAIYQHQKLAPHKIGVGFDCQRWPENIPTEPWDAALHEFISEAGVLDFTTKKLKNKQQSNE